jgi:hypothetical protein
LTLEIDPGPKTWSRLRCPTTKFAARDGVEVEIRRNRWRIFVFCLLVGDFLVDGYVQGRQIVVGSSVWFACDHVLRIARKECCPLCILSCAQFGSLSIRS